jgi:hypothetical protein
MAKKTNPEILQLKVTLMDVTPPVWRRLLVRSDATLGSLHDDIQAAMGWDDYHLHVFDHKRTRYGSMEIRDAEWEDEHSVLISEILVRAGSRLLYKYDFGDSWKHEVVVEARLPRDPAMTYPACTGGERACPPEDCGGAYGYKRLCGVLLNPDLDDPMGLREWLEEDFDPERFDLAAANRRMRR